MLGIRRETRCFEGGKRRIALSKESEGCRRRELGREEGRRRARLGREIGKQQSLAVGCDGGVEWAPCLDLGEFGELGLGVALTGTPQRANALEQLYSARYCSGRGPGRVAGFAG
jgi:hypothetical protein